MVPATRQMFHNLLKEMNLSQLGRLRTVLEAAETNPAPARRTVGNLAVMVTKHIQENRSLPADGGPSSDSSSGRLPNSDESPSSGTPPTD